MGHWILVDETVKLIQSAGDHFVCIEANYDENDVHISDERLDLEVLPEGAESILKTEFDSLLSELNGFSITGVHPTKPPGR